MKSFIWNGPAKKGDLAIFSAFPENYFRTTGEKVHDKNGLTVWDHNPYVIRGPIDGITEEVGLRKESPVQGETLVETTCIAHEINCFIKYPRFYIYEDLPKIPRSICINTTGVSNGGFSQEIINYIRLKYKDHYVFQVGGPQDLDFAGAFDYRSCSIWEQIKIVAECEQFIGLDTFFYHIASAYDIKRKTILVNKTEQECAGFRPIPQLTEPGGWQGWIQKNCEVFNPYFKDLGLTKSFLDL